MNRLSRVIVLVLVVFCGTFVGCSGSSKPEFTDVKGTVTYKGKKVTHGMVVFKAVDGDQRGVGPISSNGTFSLKSPVGPVVAAVVTRPATNQDFNNPNRPAVKEVTLPPGVNLASLPPKRFESFNTSQLNFDINTENRQPINIALK